MIKKLFPIFFLAFLLVSCTDKQTKKEIRQHQNANLFNQYVKDNRADYNKRIDDFIDSLTLEQKITQLFIENLEGCTNFRSYETIGDMNGTKDKTPLVAGGYLYFSFNIAQTRDLQKSFNQTVKDYCEQNKVLVPYLAVDQEGGWVNRLKKLNTKLPSNETVANTFTIEETYALYKSQAEQMLELGFNMNLAPVVEVCTKDNAEFLDGRSFGDYEKVIDYGRACINGYENNQIATVIKHFPGNTNTDPHTGLPEIALSKADLETSIKSFEELLKYSPAAILMSHARTSEIDPGVPACLSKVWITDIIRNKYKYDGLIFSDDIFMGALADNGYPADVAAVKAIEAGIDCIMVSEKRVAKPASVLYKKALSDSDFEQKINQAASRIIKYKIKNGIISLD